MCRRIIMNEFSIGIISKRKSIYNMQAYEGKIVIGNFWETLIISLNVWKKRDYEQQWCAGLGRIKHKKRSCLVVSVRNIDQAPLVELWALYREGNMIFIQNQLLIDAPFKRQLKKRPFNKETCYSFVSKRRTVTESGRKISEWVVPMQAIDKALVNMC